MIDSLTIAEAYYAKRRYKFQRDWCDLQEHEKALWVEVVEQVIETLREIGYFA